jgi:hypothetical protein
LQDREAKSSIISARFGVSRKMPKPLLPGLILGAEGEPRLGLQCRTTCKINKHYGDNLSADC